MMSLKQVSLELFFSCPSCFVVRTVVLKMLACFCFQNTCSRKIHEPCYSFVLSTSNFNKGTVVTQLICLFLKQHDCDVDREIDLACFLGKKNDLYLLIIIAFMVQPRNNDLLFLDIFMVHTTETS